jgi:hypothetical protein
LFQHPSNKPTEIQLLHLTSVRLRIQRSRWSGGTYRYFEDNRDMRCCSHCPELVRWRVVSDFHNNIAVQPSWQIRNNLPSHTPSCHIVRPIGRHSCHSGLEDCWSNLSCNNLGICIVLISSGRDWRRGWIGRVMIVMMRVSSLCILN